MKIATSELEHLREEVKNCHRIIKALQNKREFVGLTDDDVVSLCREFMGQFDKREFIKVTEAKLKEKNT